MRPRIVHFFGSFNQGGSERQAAALAEMLVRDGRFDVRVAVLDGSGVLRERIERLGVGNISEFPLSSFYDANFVRRVRDCRAFLSHGEISLVHSHDFYSNVFGMAAASLAGTPVRIASKRETGGMRTRAQQLVEKIAFGRSDTIVVNSDAVRRYVTDEYRVSENNIELIYNGINIEQYGETPHSGDIRAAIGVGGDERIVTLVANLRHTVKNVPMFLRMAAAVAKARTDVHFVVAGEGELEAELRQLAGRLGIAGRVHFIGRCADVPALLAASSVCVLTSQNEGFSNSLLEYMAAGRPVVATDVGGASEAVIDGETGFLVASDDDAAMSRRVIELLQDVETALRMGSAGRRRVEAEFSAAAQLRRTVDLYERLLAEKVKWA